MSYFVPETQRTFYNNPDRYEVCDEYLDLFDNCPCRFRLWHNFRCRSRRPFEITRTPAKWRALLADIQYNVMQEDGTELSGISPLDKNYAVDIYHCLGCDQALYYSEHKFDSRN